MAVAGEPTGSAAAVVSSVDTPPLRERQSAFLHNRKLLLPRRDGAPRTVLDSRHTSGPGARRTAARGRQPAPRAAEGPQRTAHERPPAGCARIPPPVYPADRRTWGRTSPARQRRPRARGVWSALTLLRALQGDEPSRNRPTTYMRALHRTRVSPGRSG
ncbi:hypothetical protein PHLGIDRAFT_119998 [Phlebiopsis gigantea 11061_1 CR5-6]|uniref:Uncharacterized protein n=1 Tax=Phlebiopsis gigantea (strain 11061_1 CR5-6) TaxID=745531 RepID=A0A0C3S4U0_PHLG1|nr:hypothetical protein PHLGIDRAFT_119998 [Phlebiopsis gigantea 11061_1 CR5-6]